MRARLARSASSAHLGLLQLLGHLVERSVQLLDLARAARLHALVQVAGGQPAGGLHQLVQRAPDGAGQRHHQAHGAQQRQQPRATRDQRGRAGVVARLGAGASARRVDLAGAQRGLVSLSLCQRRTGLAGPGGDGPAGTAAQDARSAPGPQPRDPPAGGWQGRPPPARGRGGRDRRRRPALAGAARPRPCRGPGAPPAPPRRRQTAPTTRPPASRRATGRPRSPGGPSRCRRCPPRRPAPAPASARPARRSGCGPATAAAAEPSFFRVCLPAALPWGCGVDHGLETPGHEGRRRDRSGARRAAGRSRAAGRRGRLRRAELAGPGGRWPVAAGRRAERACRGRLQGRAAPDARGSAGHAGPGQPRPPPLRVPVRAPARAEGTRRRCAPTPRSAARSRPPPPRRPRRATRRGHRRRPRRLPAERHRARPPQSAPGHAATAPAAAAPGDAQPHPAAAGLRAIDLPRALPAPVGPLTGGLLDTFVAPR